MKHREFISGESADEQPEVWVQDDEEDFEEINKTVKFTQVRNRSTGHTSITQSQTI